MKTHVGGGFGGKIDPTGLDFSAVKLSQITGRPVKMLFDRKEMFYNNRGRHAQYMELTTGVTKEGKILGVHANFVMDGGAYTGLGVASAYYAGALLTVLYDLTTISRYDSGRRHLPGSGAQRAMDSRSHVLLESQLTILPKIGH